MVSISIVTVYMRQSVEKKTLTPLAPPTALNAFYKNPSHSKKQPPQSEESLTECYSLLMNTSNFSESSSFTDEGAEK